MRTTSNKPSLQAAIESHRTHADHSINEGAANRSRARSGWPNQRHKASTMETLRMVHLERALVAVVEEARGRRPQQQRQTRQHRGLAYTQTIKRS